MCMQFSITRKEMAVLAALGVVLSPLWIVGGVIGGSAMLVKHAGRKAARKLRRRRERALQKYQPDPATSSRLQQCFDRLKTDNQETHRGTVPDSELLEGGMLCFAVGDLLAASQFFERILARPDRWYGSAVTAARIHAEYFGALVFMQLRRWQRGAERMERAVDSLDRLGELVQNGHAESAHEQRKIGVVRSDALIAAAYMRYLAAVYPELHVTATLLPSARSTDDDSKRVGPGSELTLDKLRTARTTVNRALEELAAKGAGSTDGSTRAHSVAAWINFRLAFEGDAQAGAPHNLNRAALNSALEHVDTAIHAAARDHGVHINAEEDSGSPFETALVEALSVAAADIGSVTPQTGDGRATPRDDSEADEEDEAPIDAAVAMGASAPVDLAQLLSLKAQILCAAAVAAGEPHNNKAAAGEILTLARRLDPDVQHSSAEEEGVDPVLALYRPWALPRDDFVSDDEITRHNFQETALFRPTWCDYCNKFISVPKALRCTMCRYTIHNGHQSTGGECLCKAAESPCQQPAVDARPPEMGEPQQTPVMPHIHRLKHRRVHTTHECAFCAKNVTCFSRAYHCVVCARFAHVDCAKSQPEAGIVL